MKSERLDRAPPKYTAFSFAWLLTKGVEVPVLITRVDGFDVFYRIIRGDGLVAQESVVHAKTMNLRPAQRNEFTIMVFHEPPRGRGWEFEVVLPKLDAPGQVAQVAKFEKQPEAVKHARDVYGADSRGRISIVRGIPRKEVAKSA